MIKKSPFFSIIIPTLNEAGILPLLLSDLARQTNQDFEVIIVDGSSPDHTSQKALAYKNKISLQLIKTKTRNVSFQRNLGAKSALANILLFMDADNRLSNTFIHDLKVKIIATNPEIFTCLIKPDSSFPSHRLTALIINAYINLTKKTSTPFVIESLLGFSKKLFLKLNGFDPSLPNCEGNDLLKRALVLGYRHQLYNYPRYTYSLRRLSKEGLLKLTLNTFRLEIPRLLGKKLDQKTAAKLYPMQGGLYHQQSQSYKH